MSHHHHHRRGCEMPQEMPSCPREIPIRGRCEVTPCGVTCHIRPRRGRRMGMGWDE